MSVMIATTVHCKLFKYSISAQNAAVQALLLLCASLILGLAFYSNADASSGNPTLGQLVWESNAWKCPNCHSIGNPGLPEGNRLNAANASNVIQYAIDKKYGGLNKMESLVGISQAELDNVAAYIATFVPSSTDQAITYNTTKAFALPYIFVNTPLVSSPATTTFNSIVTVAPPSKGTVSFSYSGNIATASYTPSSNKTGADSFSYLGKGPAGDSSIRTVNITINAPAPVITNPGSMTAASGADINYQIIATNSPTSYSVAAAGLTLSVDSSGLVTGILPSVTSPSSYSVTISASNAGGTDSETFVLTINPPAPLVTNTGAMTASSGATFAIRLSPPTRPPVTASRRQD